MVITGGPGTGKTTIINAILKIFSKLGVKHSAGRSHGKSRQANERNHRA
ncbi:MAG: AAA family ATPase [Deltaproteobacteria bacterium]|nr:AAA family ATPase [Deltaproteobacteria bacterium]